MVSATVTQEVAGGRPFKQISSFLEMKLPQAARSDEPANSGPTQAPPGLEGRCVPAAGQAGSPSCRQAPGYGARLAERGSRAQRHLGLKPGGRLGRTALRGLRARLREPCGDRGALRRSRSSAAAKLRGQKQSGASAAPAAPSAPSATRTRRSASQAGSKSQAAEKRRLRRSSLRAQEEGPGEPPPPELALLPPLPPTPTSATPTSSASNLDLGEQRERCETLQKRQLTSEGPAKLLLDTLLMAASGQKEYEDPQECKTRGVFKAYRKRKKEECETQI
ncbi:uncharacterized protein LOC134760610 [Pongo abelii]|uniref:uncharacterized protein LOC134760610 n=1 Tax=Pongo abelii TaxID=9601 RepID=UPI003007B142